MGLPTVSQLFHLGMVIEIQNEILQHSRTYGFGARIGNPDPVGGQVAAVGEVQKCFIVTHYG